MSSVIEGRPSAAGDSFARRTSVCAFVIALCATGAWWVTFSGPFRWLVDLQMRGFGHYWEGLAAVALFFIAFGVVWLPSAVLVSTTGRRLPTHFVNVIVVAVVAGVSIAALWTAWQLWQDTRQRATLQAPLQVVDLADASNATTLPVGHVRVLGIAARDRAVPIRIVGRRGLGGHTDRFVPVTSRQEPDRTVPVRIVAVSSDRDTEQAVPDDPEGILLEDVLDTRTLYRLREGGIALVDRPSVLYWYSRQDLVTDDLIGAGILSAMVVFTWLFIAVSLIRQRFFGATSPGAAAVAPGPDAQQADAPSADAALAGPTKRDRETFFSRCLFGAGLLCIATAGLY